MKATLSKRGMLVSGALTVNARLEVFEVDHQSGIATVRVYGDNGPRHRVSAGLIGFVKCGCGDWFYPRRLGQTHCVATCGSSERVKLWRAKRKTA